MLPNSIVKLDFGVEPSSRQDVGEEYEDSAGHIRYRRYCHLAGMWNKC